MKRPNVHVRTHAHATNIIFEGKRAVGVRYIKGGKGGTPVEVRAAKEVILAGGTYNSPQLLQLSGVGSPELLGSLGIEVRHALAGRRRGIAGPLRAAFGRPRQEHQDHQRTPARPQPVGGGAEMGHDAARPAVAVADHGLLLLAFRREHRKLRPAADLHAGELQGGRAGPARGRARHDRGLLAAAAGKPRLCPRPLGRSVRAADHPDQLSGRGARPPHRGRRHEAGAAAAVIGAAGAVLRL